MYFLYMCVCVCLRLNPFLCHDNETIQHPVQIKTNQAAQQVELNPSDCQMQGGRMVQWSAAALTTRRPWVQFRAEHVFPLSARVLARVWKTDEWPNTK